MKRLLAVLLAGLMLFALAGCSSDPEQPGEIQPDGDAQTPFEPTETIDQEGLWKRLAGVWQREDGNYIRFYTRGSQLRLEVGLLDEEGACTVHADGELTKGIQNDHEYTLTISFDATSTTAAYLYSMYLSDLNLGSGSLLASDTMDNGRVASYLYAGESIQQLQEDLKQQETNLAAIWQSLQGAWVCYYPEGDAYYFTMQSTGQNGEMIYTTGIPFSGAMLSGPVREIRKEEANRYVLTVDFPAEEASEMSEAREAFQMEVTLETGSLTSGVLQCTIPFAAEETLVSFRYAGPSLDSITFELLDSLKG